MIPAILIILIVHIIIAVRRMLIKILSAVINDWEQINDFINPRSVECRNNSLGNRNRTNIKHWFKFTHAAGHACRNDQCANFHRKSPKRAVFQIILQFYRIVNKYNSKYILPGKQKATLASSEGG